MYIGLIIFRIISVLFHVRSVFSSVYISVRIRAYSVLNSDPPPAEALLLTDAIVRERMNDELSDDKYNEILKLQVEPTDQDTLREAEKRRKDRVYQGPTVNEVSSGKGKNTSNFCFCINFNLSYNVICPYEVVTLLMGWV